MKKFIKWIGITAMVFTLFGVGALVADSMVLRDNVVRLHVVANSDAEEDQMIKLAVRDAVLAYLKEDVAKQDNAAQAKEYLSTQLPQLEELANNTLTELGSMDKAHVRLTTETFDIRQYDTFSLPSGVYDSLRIEIGQGNGKNWWCVVFPALCLPTTTDGFEDVAAAAGFNESLVDTLAGGSGYEIRFYLLDCLGRLENIFFS